MSSVNITKNIISQNNLFQQHTWENSWNWSLKNTLLKCYYDESRIFSIKAILTLITTLQIN